MYGEENQMLENEKYKKAIETLFYIVNKEGESVPFKLKPEQLMVMNDLTGQDIILKSRQQGVSSLILAIFTVDFLTVENIKCVIISHESGATQRLLDRAKYFMESLSKTFPGSDPYKLKYNSRNEIVNLKKNSSFYIGTAGQRAFGHGETINNLHLSEYSRYPDAERLLSGVLQAVPKGGKIFIESTANGYNHFYKLWQENSKSGAVFKDHFIPWFVTPEYLLPVPNGTELEPEELAILNTYHLSKEQMMWRRWKINQLGGSMDKFNESFPATAEEAFILSGNPVWPPSLMKWYLLQIKKPTEIGNLVGFNPVSIEENEKGYLSIFKRPNEFHNYTIGADVSEGKIVAEGDDAKESDYSCAQVIDQTTFEQVAVWYGRLDPDLFGRQIDLLGRYYNEALVAVERNSMGLTTLTALRDLNYPNLYYREKFGLISEKTTSELGWLTDEISKDILVNDATQLFREKRIMLYDEGTIGEMMSFIRDNHGRARAASGTHDDKVMSLLIAIKMLGNMKSRSKGNQIEQENIDRENGMFVFNGVPFNGQGMPMNPDDIYEKENLDFSQ